MSENKLISTPLVGNSEASDLYPLDKAHKRQCSPQEHG